MDSLQNNQSKLKMLTAQIIIIIGLSIFAFYKTLFKKEGNKIKFIKEASYALFAIFLTYIITYWIPDKYEHILNMFLAVILIILFSILKFSKDVFTKDNNLKKPLNILSDFGLIYVSIWILLKQFKKNMTTNNISGNLKNKWNKSGFIICFIMLCSIISTIALGKVYREDVSTKKKTMTAVGCTLLFTSSIYIIQSKS